MKWDEGLGAATNARHALPAMVSAYFAGGREFLAQKFAPAELHRLRLASKKLRYTLELFRPCYPAALEERIDALKKLQDRLGAVNDAVASRNLLDEALRHRPKVRKFLDDRAAEQAAGFAQHWKEAFDAPGQEAWWMEFLAQKARTPKAEKQE